MVRFKDVCAVAVTNAGSPIVAVPDAAPVYLQYFLLFQCRSENSISTREWTIRIRCLLPLGKAFTVTVLQIMDDYSTVGTR
jgi:hypothetical protein